MAKHDEQVQALMAKVAEKKVALGPRPKKVLVTNGLLKFSDVAHVNLNTLNDLDDLLMSYARILQRHHTLMAAADDLEAGAYTPTFSGYTLEDWREDFMFRVQLIAWQKKESELNAMSKQLESLVSEDLKTATALDKILKALG